ncbi:MAG: thiol-disulfide oxidoreductase DCC family protein [Pseudobdellovibrio sp.]
MKRIVFFDGVCKLCHGVVDWFLPQVTIGSIYFAPLQGTTARELLTAQDLGLDGVVYFRDGTIYRKSQAIFWLIQDSNSKLKVFKIMFQFIPIFICDFFYDLIAKSRYNIFGKTQICRIPNEKEKAYFLD